MPYIKSGGREYWDNLITQIEYDHNRSNYAVGDLNYFISKLLWRELQRNKSYNTANALIGLLECIKQEFYRRQIAIYEDVKKQENGDLEIN